MWTSFKTLDRRFQKRSRVGLAWRGVGDRLACDPRWPAVVVFGCPHVFYHPSCYCTCYYSLPVILPTHICTCSRTNTHIIYYKDPLSTTVCIHLRDHNSFSANREMSEMIKVMFPNAKPPKHKLDTTQLYTRDYEVVPVLLAEMWKTEKNICLQAFWTVSYSTHTHTQQITEASLGFWLNWAAICLSPTSTNQLPQLGLEVKFTASLKNREREREIERDDRCQEQYY